MERRLATRVTRDFKSLRNAPWMFRNASLLSILVLFSPFAFGQEVPRRMALVVGVSDYFHKNMEDLKFAEKDAKDVGLQLQRLGFEVTQVTGREATKTKVEAEISSFLAKASQLDSDSIVFILFSGHGQQLRVTRKVGALESTEEVPFFCPRDAIPFDSKIHTLRGKSAASIAKELKLVSLNQLLVDIDTQSNSLNNMLVIDACRNNPAKGKAPGITGASARELPRGIGILFAAKSGQKSWESSDPKVQQGILTHFLLKGLQGEARNRRQQITWSRLISYVREEVEFEGWKLVGGREYQQNPHALTNSAETIIIDSYSYRTQERNRKEWPMWGGSPSRNGVSSAQGIPLDWNIETGLNIKWSAALGSETYASPVVSGGKVFVGTNNEAGYLKRFPSDRDLGTMLCFDESNGEFLWQYSAERLKPTPGKTRMHYDWPIIGIVSTPLAEENRIWFVDNRCQVVCLDVEGFRDGTNDGAQNEARTTLDEADVVWQFDMMQELGVLPLMKAVCSPVALGDRLFLVTGNGVDYENQADGPPAAEAPSFVCLDKNTGKLLWKSNLPGENILSGQWGSPAILDHEFAPQVLFPGGDGWLYSFTPEGELLWKFDCNPKESEWDVTGGGSRNTLFGLPVVSEGRIYIGVGRSPEMGEGNGVLWCIDSTKRGDVSAELVLDRAGNPVSARRLSHVDASRGESVVANPNSAVVWKFTSVSPKLDPNDLEFEDVYHRMIGAVAVHRGVVYACDFSGLFHAIDAATGRRIGYYDSLSYFWASPTVVDENVFLCNADGEVAIFDTGSIEARLGTLLNGELEPSKKFLFDSSIHAGVSVAGRALFVAARNKLFAIQDSSSAKNEVSP